MLRRGQQCPKLKKAGTTNGPAELSTLTLVHSVVRTTGGRTQFAGTARHHFKTSRAKLDNHVIIQRQVTSGSLQAAKTIQAGHQAVARSIVLWGHHNEQQLKCGQSVRQLQQTRTILGQPTQCQRCQIWKLYEPTSIVQLTPDWNKA